MRRAAGQVVARANPVVYHAMPALAVFMIIASAPRVRTRLVVIPAIRAILTLLCLTDTPGHERLQFCTQLRNVIVSGLNGIRRKCRVRKIHAPGRILHAIVRLTSADLNVLQLHPQFSDMIVADFDDIRRKRDIGKRRRRQNPAGELLIDLYPQFLNMVVSRLNRICGQSWIRPRRRVC